MTRQRVALRTHTTTRVSHHAGVTTDAVVSGSHPLTHRRGETGRTHESVVHGEDSVLPPVGVFVPRRVGDAGDHGFGCESFLDRFEDLVAVLDVEARLRG